MSKENYFLMSLGGLFYIIRTYPLAVLTILGGIGAIIAITVLITRWVS